MTRGASTIRLSRVQVQQFGLLSASERSTTRRPTPAFRHVEPGEQRVYGIFEAVECTNDGIALLVRTSDGVLRACTTSLWDVDFISYRPTAPSSVDCGKLASRAEVYLTGTVPPDASTAAQGTAVAVEFLPEGFVP